MNAAVHQPGPAPISTRQHCSFKPGTASRDFFLDFLESGMAATARLFLGSIKEPI
jgi:hypothetical protein